MGCCIYIIIWTCPDKGYAVNLLSSYLTRLSEALIKAAKKILADLKYTRKLGLQFRRSGNDCTDWDSFSMITWYMDASDTDCLIMRLST